MAPRLSPTSTLYAGRVSSSLFSENPPTGVPPELSFVYFLAGRARATLRGSQPGHRAQGLPAVANLDALQGVPRVYPPERSEDDERAAQGLEGEIHRAATNCAAVFCRQANEQAGLRGAVTWRWYFFLLLEYLVGGRSEIAGISGKHTRAFLIHTRYYTSP